ncbi:HIT domain-containing protein [Candidatus Saccharibacteria bacterium]|mgnify:CR=1 FL=1|nr:HIT domain-containing protein [Candidatus Saccharibacteria bacterium]
MESVFTKIVKGEIPCYKIYEDEKTLAFLDIHPESMGHTLVIPKVQVDKVYELSDDDYAALFSTVKKVAQRMEKVLGVRTLMKVVGTDVPHAHVHLMPYDTSWEHGRTLEPTEAEMKEMQEKLAF